MTYAAVGAFIAGVLVIVYRLLSQARVDSVISSLKQEEALEKAKKYQEEVARVEQEIKDAKLRYSNAKRTLDQYPSSGSVSGADEDMPGRD